MKFGLVICLNIGLFVPSAMGNEISGHHHHGDRHGTHGMALFGESTYYLSHIPMDRRPHNEQLILKVVIEDAEGNKVLGSFADAGYSVRPREQFSLDNLVMGLTESFSGDIHVGNFEHGGEVLLSGVLITVEKVVVARNLGDSVDAEYSSYVLQESKTWLINRIGPDRNKQEITLINPIDQLPMVNSGVALKVSLSSGEGGDVLYIKKAGSNAGSALRYQEIATNWCLQGPDFFQSCGG